MPRSGRNDERSHGWQTYSMAASGLHSDWLRLVSMLDSWAQSAVPRGDDIAVTLEFPGGSSKSVVTPDDLDMLRVANGELHHLSSGI